MKVNDLFFQGHDAYIYMERYVNNGSPSGYTLINTTSNKTSPFFGEKEFKLYTFCDTNYVNYSFGIDKNEIFNGCNYIHPDSYNSSVLKGFNISFEKTSFSVIPTSSSRTVLVNDDKKYYFLKLTYDMSKIGRCDRQISKISALASYENSEFIMKCIDNKKLPAFLAILPESFAKTTVLENSVKSYEWGTIYREIVPYPIINKVTSLIPAFALFSKDQKNREDEYLINQLIMLSNISAKEYLLNLIFMLVDSYWTLLINCGLSAELHSQNCLIEIDRNYRVNRIIIKDMEDVDRDNYIARLFNIKTNWFSTNYKTFDINSPDYKYRTSYMYDFKFGEYLLKPLIDVVCQKNNINQNYFYEVIRTYVRNNYLLKLPEEYFFSKNSWFSRSNEDDGTLKRKKYIENKNPKFR